MIDPTKVKYLLLPGLWGKTAKYPGVQTDIDVDHHGCSLFVKAWLPTKPVFTFGFTLVKQDLENQDILVKKFPRLTNTLLETMLIRLSPNVSIGSSHG